MTFVLQQNPAAHQSEVGERAGRQRAEDSLWIISDAVVEADTCRMVVEVVNTENLHVYVPMNTSRAERMHPVIRYALEVGEGEGEGEEN